MFGADAWNELLIMAYSAMMFALLVIWFAVLPSIGFMWVMGWLP